MLPTIGCPIFKKVNQNQPAKKYVITMVIKMCFMDCQEFSQIDFLRKSALALKSWGLYTFWDTHIHGLASSMSLCWLAFAPHFQALDYVLYLCGTSSCLAAEIQWSNLCTKKTALKHAQFPNIKLNITISFIMLHENCRWFWVGLVRY